MYGSKGGQPNKEKNSSSFNPDSSPVLEIFSKIEKNAHNLCFYIRFHNLLYM